jgi:hypothetical protein
VSVHDLGMKATPRWGSADLCSDRNSNLSFSSSKYRILPWDIRAVREPINGFKTLDSISGVCMPFWDDGTNMLLFLAPVWPLVS